MIPKVFALGNPFPPTPTPRQQLISFLSLYTTLHFMGFYINGVIQCCPIFCLTSFTHQNYFEIFHVVAFINSSVLYIAM